MAEMTCVCSVVPTPTRNVHASSRESHPRHGGSTRHVPPPQELVRLMDWEEFYFRCSVIVISCLGAFAYCAFEHRYPAKSATWAAPLLSAMVLMGDLIPYSCGDLGWGPVEKHSQNENHWAGWRVSRGGAWVEPCLKLHPPHRRAGACSLSRARSVRSTLCAGPHRTGRGSRR